MISWVQNILGGVFASIAAALIMAATNWGYNRWTNYRLQTLLGISFNKVKRVSLVYGKMELPKDENPKPHPFIKPPRNVSISSEIDERCISITSPVSECEIRATNYISSLFGKTRQIDLQMVSDVKSFDILDATFISLGGPISNYKTEDILDAPENIFVRVASWLDTTTDSQFNQPIHMSENNFRIVGESFHIKRECDYGLILRTTPTGHPNNAWLVCAGIGEWGTSGATWYLAKRWEILRQKLQTSKYRIGKDPIPDFAVIVEVEKGRDESADIKKVYKKQGDGVVEVNVSQSK